MSAAWGMAVSPQHWQLQSAEWWHRCAELLKLSESQTALGGACLGVVSLWRRQHGHAEGIRIAGIV